MSRDAHALVYPELTEVEHQKIIQLCSTYGLNQQETKQLIVDIQTGKDHPPGVEPEVKAQSSKLLSIVSAKNQQLSFNDSQFKYGSEYSFRPEIKLGITSQEHSFEKALMQKVEEDEYQSDMIGTLKAQNEQLQRQKMDLLAKVDMLLSSKTQQSDIILGLKNAVCTLTSLLKDKQQAYTDLQDNYQKLSNTLQQKLATQKGAVQRPQRDYNRRPEQRQLRQSTLTESTSNLERRQSKDFSKNRSSQNICQRSGQMRQQTRWMDNTSAGLQNRESRENQKAGMKKPRLDMSKYKVFIDQLKSICVSKPQRI